MIAAAPASVRQEEWRELAGKILHQIEIALKLRVGSIEHDRILQGEISELLEAELEDTEIDDLRERLREYEAGGRCSCKCKACSLGDH